MIDWKPRAEALAAELADAGAVRDPAWRAVFAAPRHLFVPRFYARDQYGQPRTLVDGSDPEQRGSWLELVPDECVGHPLSGHRGCGDAGRAGSAGGDQLGVDAGDRGHDAGSAPGA